jgi:hypothetical protein
MGEMRNAYNILVKKPEERRILERPGRRWEYNIRMYLRAVVWFLKVVWYMAFLCPYKCLYVKQLNMF